MPTERLRSPGGAESQATSSDGDNISFLDYDADVEPALLASRKQYQEYARRLSHQLDPFPQIGEVCTPHG